MFRENVLRIMALVLVLGSLVLTGCQTTGRVNLKSMTIDTATSADGSRIAYDVKGEGDVAIVFVHCWTCNSSFWDGQVEFFAEDYRVVTLDLAAHGRSVSRRSNYSVEAFGKDVAAVVEEVGAKKVILVGHSMGGPVSLAAARLLGDKVVGIVGVDMFYTGWQHPASDSELEKFMQPFKDNYTRTSSGMVRSMFTPKADPKLVDSIVTEMSMVDKGAALEMMSGIVRWLNTEGDSYLKEFAPLLANINAAPKGTEQPLHKSVTMMNGVGHFIPQVAPDRFNEVLAGEVKVLLSGKSCDK